MAKKTTAQVKKALGITKLQVYTILSNYPHLRPREQAKRAGYYLWSEEEITALSAHLATHPYTRRGRRRHDSSEDEPNPP